MTVLVYGASGRTGLAVAGELRAAGERVVLAGRDRGRVDEVAARLGLTSRAAGARSTTDLERAMRGIDVAVQCAALSVAENQAFVDVAVRRGVAYVDVCADRLQSDAVTASLGATAARRGVPLCFGVAPVGGALGEWLGLLAAQRLAVDNGGCQPETLQIAYASDALPGSAGSLRSSLSMLLHATRGEVELRAFDLPPPFTRETGFAFPFGTGRLQEWFPGTRLDVYAALRWGGLDSATTAEIVARLARWRSSGLGRFGRRFDPLFARVVEVGLPRGPADLATPRLAVAAHAISTGSSAAVAVTAEDGYGVTARMVALVVAALPSLTGRGGVVGAGELVDPELALDDLVGTAGVRRYESPAAPPPAHRGPP